MIIFLTLCYIGLILPPRWIEWVGDRFAERSDGDLILLVERRPMGRAAVKDALERARRACP